MPVFTADGLGMELDTLYIQRTMPHTHNGANTFDPIGPGGLFGPGSHFKTQAGSPDLLPANDSASPDNRYPDL